MARPERSLSHPAPSLETAATSERELIGVVEDEPIVRRALGRLLGSMGFHVALFTSAEEFLAHRSGAHFSFLLLDGHLPGMSGHELLNHLADIGDELPVVLISSDASSIRGTCNPNARLVRVVHKPLDIKVLELVLSTAGDRHGSEPPPAGRQLLSI